MNPEDKRITDELYTSIEKHNHLYYIEADSTISDAEYDELVKVFEGYMRKYPELTLPLGVKGGDVDHINLMLSLKSVNEVSKLDTFLTRLGHEIGIVIEHKLDGLALELVYRHGRLRSSSTRGDGITGEDITANAYFVAGIPVSLPETVDAEVYGEICLDKKSFDLINRLRIKEKKAQYSSPRNAAAGIVRSSSAKPELLNMLSFIPYTTYAEGVISQHESYKWLDTMGFKYWSSVCTTDIVAGMNIEEAVAVSETQRSSLNFDVDGLVLKVELYEERDRIGLSNRHPNWALAFKYPPEEATTTLNEVDFQLGRTGILTPVGYFKPVRLLGRKISKATLHNIPKILEKDLRLGDTIVVQLANDVIPYIARAIKEDRSDLTISDIEYPKLCPSCIMPLSEQLNEIGQLKYLYCSYDNCSQKLILNINYMLSRKVLDIDGFGPSVVNTLVITKMIKTFSDIYLLNRHKDQMIEEFGEKTALKLLKNIDDRREITLKQFIQLLNVDNISGGISTNLARSFLTIDALLNNYNDVLSLKIPNLSADVRDDLLKALKSSARSLYMDLISNGVKVKDLINLNTNEIFVAITGKLESLSKKELTSLIVEIGGSVKSSVSRNIDYLVVGTKPGSKLAKAKKLGIPILTEYEMLKVLDGFK